MCTLCGYTSSNFWADFAIDANGTLSPSAVRPRQAALLGRWAALAGQAARPLTLDLADALPPTPSSGLFSGAWIKAGVRGFTVSSPTGAMRFCSSLRTVLEQMRLQRPALAGRLRCVWPQDHLAVDWAAFGAAWTWNAFMNDDHVALPPVMTLLDGRRLQIDPQGDDTLYVTLLDRVLDHEVAA
ncbi:hypothetical protein [Amphibiibacter pelophylacis]|uniref:Uncharacterized protein n=1 Tax=Amphibiibacter pelophylacis TaxID=1799477 RepID=A0ACC6P3Z1_9BURK